jgi:hypothetical protein
MGVCAEFLLIRMEKEWKYITSKAQVCVQCVQCVQCVCVSVCERERERKGMRERERERKRALQRETD